MSVVSVGPGWWRGLWASVCVVWVCGILPSGNYLCISRDNFCSLGAGKAWKSHEDQCASVKGQMRSVVDGGFSLRKDMLTASCSGR